MTDFRRYYSQDQLNNIAYEEFTKEVHSVVLNFEHIIDAKTGMMPINKKNVDLLLESIGELKETAKEFKPYFGGQDIGMEWDFSDCLWDEINNAIGN